MAPLIPATRKLTQLLVDAPYVIPPRNIQDNRVKRKNQFFVPALWMIPYPKSIPS
jgi:hypothetical protein